MSLEEKRRYWQEVIAAWESSELSQPSFCREHNLSYSQFCYWRHEFNKEKKQEAGHFIPLQLEPQEALAEIKPLSISLSDEVKIEVSHESQLPLVAHLLKVLR